MPKKKIAADVRAAKASKQPPGKARTIPIESGKSPVSPFPASFENKAGRYELIRIDGDQAYYSFTNLANKTVDAAMPVVTWRKMCERAAAALKETA